MSSSPKQRPIDPTKNAQDVFGDTSGLTGITTSSPQEGGADPTEKIPDSSNLPGTLVNEPKATPTYGIPREATSNKVYKQNVRHGMSEDEGKDSDERAAENETPNTNDYEQTLDIDDITQQGQPDEKYTKPTVPSVVGEESISGDMPTPDADADMEQAAQDVGTQEEEDTEHPEELDIGRDIDKAEESIKES